MPAAAAPTVTVPVPVPMSISSAPTPVVNPAVGAMRAATSPADRALSSSVSGGADASEVEVEVEVEVEGEAAHDDEFDDIFLSPFRPEDSLNLTTTFDPTTLDLGEEKE